MLDLNDNKKIFECEEREIEIERMQRIVRQHIHDDQRKIEVLKKIYPASENIEQLKRAIVVAIVDSQLRLAYLDGLLFDARAIQATLRFSPTSLREFV